MEPMPLTVSEGRHVISSNITLLPFGSSMVCVETSNVNSGGGTRAQVPSSPNAKVFRSNARLRDNRRFQDLVKRMGTPERI
jgi:hypothetical protein